MKKNHLIIGLLALLTTMVLAACDGNEESNPNGDANTETESNENMDMNEEGTEPNENTDEKESDSMEGMDHSGMNHSSSGEVPEDLAEAGNPTYSVGSQAIINANHMEGMDGAKATIDGAYNTTVYAVSYTPKNGGEPIKNHKWVIHEELENPGDAPLEPGTEATINASHMEGMDGVTAMIDSAEQTTVYMVSYTDTETGKEVTNHKWVTEAELSPVEG
ncbi:YdhK family protein [Virgibacillus siamensis]|uniref:YdhK family protein n=1 Tax=Virgibacillus siamensis TaxID=480071 RepID=A0ABP3QMM0_9BACI